MPATASVKVSAKLAPVFHGDDKNVVTTIAGLVDKFTFEKAPVDDNSSGKPSKGFKNSLNVKIAPTFGTLDSTTIKDLDGDVKVMVAATNNLLVDAKPSGWDKLQSFFSNNDFVSGTDEPIFVPSNFDQTDTHWLAFIFGESDDVDPETIQKINSWFSRMVTDKDALDAIHFNEKVFKKILEFIGTGIKQSIDYEDVFPKTESFEKVVVDITVLRYPDPAQPNFKAFNIQLKAYRDKISSLPVNKVTNGIKGTFHSISYKPKASVIGGMKESSKEKAQAAALEMFN